MRPPRVAILLAVGFLLVLVFAGEAVSGRTPVYPMLSTSPENPGPGGTLAFYRDLRQRAHVILGNARDLEIQAYSGKATYILVGIDLPLTGEETATVARLVRSGRVNLLIAEETSAVNPLLRALGLPPIGEIIIGNTSIGEGWEYVVSMTCWNETIITTKAARLSVGKEGKVICTYSDGTPAAVLYELNGSRVLVVGDSSIFSNFLYDIPPVWARSTREVALRLAGMVVEGVVVFDNTHYESIEARASLSLLPGLAGELARALGDARRVVGGLSPSEAAVLALALIVPWPAILLHPVGPERWEDKHMSAAVEELETSLAARLGLGEGAQIDRVLEELERRGLIGVERPGRPGADTRGDR